MAEPVVTVGIYDLDTNLLADISPIALTKRVMVRHNQPRACVIGCPSNDALLTATAGDGYPILNEGDRKIVMLEDGEPVFHGRLWGIEWNGDGRNNRVAITAFDPLKELGTEGDGQAGRPVRDVTGNFISPSFASPITGGDLIYQMLVNSGQTGVETDPTPGEGPLPIDLTTGDFDLTGVDLSPENNMSWPVMIGDMIQQLVSTGVVDVYGRPIAPSEGFAYEMVALSAVNAFGADVSGSVHFDYATGSFNARQAKVVADFSTICNKLYDYLGPRLNETQWGGNITPGSPGTTVDPTASRARYGGQFMEIRFYDALDVNVTARPLYIALWNAEMGLRVVPRRLLFLTPSSGAKALFRPFTDYNVGDVVGVNLAGAFGLSIADTQRVMGFDVEWDRNGVQRVGQLLTTADV